MLSEMLVTNYADTGQIFVEIEGRRQREQRVPCGFAFGVAFLRIVNHYMSLYRATRKDVIEKLKAQLRVLGEMCCNGSSSKPLLGRKRSKGGSKPRADAALFTAR